MNNDFIALAGTINAIRSVVIMAFVYALVCGIWSEISAFDLNDPKPLIINNGTNGCTILGPTSTTLSTATGTETHTGIFSTTIQGLDNNTTTVLSEAVTATATATNHDTSSDEAATTTAAGMSSANDQAKVQAEVQTEDEAKDEAEDKNETTELKSCTNITATDWHTITTHLRNQKTQMFNRALMCAYVALGSSGIALAMSYISSHHRRVLKAHIDVFQEENDAMFQVVDERNQFLLERNRLLDEQNRLLGERDGLVENIARLVEQRDRVVEQRDRLFDERDRLLFERESVGAGAGGIPPVGGLFGPVRGPVHHRLEPAVWDDDDGPAWFGHRRGHRYDGAGDRE